MEILKIVNSIKPLLICQDLETGKVFHRKCMQINSSLCCKRCCINDRCDWTCSNYLMEKKYGDTNEFCICKSYKEVYK